MAKRDFRSLVQRDLKNFSKPDVVIKANDYDELPIESIITEDQVRTKNNILEGIKPLAENINRFGQLEPVGVIPKPDGKFLLIFGYRRYYALQLLKQKPLP